MSSILDEILEHKRTEIAALDVGNLRRAAESAPEPRDFLAAVRPSPRRPSPTGRSRSTPKGRDGGEGETTAREANVKLIAELKLASPSKGVFAPHLDLFQVADIYAQNGAAAISVLTDEEYFLGKLETLRELRGVQKIPLLRKDFIIDESQVYQSRANGADGMLLIVAALPDNGKLSALHALAVELGLTPLVEVHTAEELERASKIPGLKLVGVNNRDLTTFKVMLVTTEQLRPRIPKGIGVVAESGIFTADDVVRLAAVNVDAVLVGEALITAPNIRDKVKELAGVSQKNL